MSGPLDAVVRRLDAADAAGFQDLRRTALCTDPAAFAAHPEDPEEAKQEPEHWRWRVLRSPVWAAVAPGGRLLGMLGWYRGGGIKIAHRAFIWGLFVRPEARRQGLAKRLLAEVVKEVRATSGVESLWAEVTADQEAAQALYEGKGVTCCGVVPRALQVEDRVLDERLLVLFLRQDGTLPAARRGAN